VNGKEFVCIEASAGQCAASKPGDDPAIWKPKPKKPALAQQTETYKQAVTDATLNFCYDYNPGTFYYLGETICGADGKVYKCLLPLWCGLYPPVDENGDKPAELVDLETKISDTVYGGYIKSGESTQQTIGGDFGEYIENSSGELCFAWELNAWYDPGQCVFDVNTIYYCGEDPFYTRCGLVRPSKDPSKDIWSEYDSATAEVTLEVPETEKV